MIKIAFLDFDGTLYSHFSNSIPASAVKAINAMHDNGIKIFLCSGRAICEMEYFDTSMIHIDGMIANNGQVCYDENNKVIFDYPIEGQLKEEIISKFNKKTVPILINTGDTLFLNFVNDKVTQTQSDINSPVPQVKEYENERFYMCSAFYNDCKDWVDLLSLKNLANITYWHDGAVDIVPNTSSKADAIKQLIDHLGIKQEETIGFGDGDNDIKMLQFCNIGVAVGNASDECKKAATYVSEHIEEDGIYNACKHFNLI